MAHKQQKDETSFGERLTADNYQSWKFRCMMALKGKDLWEITNGEEIFDAEAPEDLRRRWKKRDSQAHSLVCLGVSDPLQIYVRTTKNAKEAWDSLSGHFEEKSLSKMIYYRRKMYESKLKTGESMIDHINKLQSIRESMEALDDPVSDRDFVMILMSSLPAEYNYLITALETIKEGTLTPNYLRDRLIAEYDRRNAERTKKLEDALYVKSHGNGNRGNRGNHNEGSGAGKKNLNKFKCHHCKEKGHFSKNCPKKNKSKDEEKEESSYCHGDVVEEITGNLDAFCFEPEFALTAGGDNEYEDNDNWWIDSACSRHMSGNESDFTEIRELKKPVSVNLADKSCVPAAGVGNVNLVLIDENGDNVPVVVPDVLYVPKLKKKLLSVPTLDDRGAEISFKRGVCTMSTNGRKFVFGQKEGKLYKVLTGSISSCNFTSASTKSLSSLNLWHLRLGHLNNQDVKKLSYMVKGLIVNKKDVPTDCEGCFL